MTDPIPEQVYLDAASAYIKALRAYDRSLYGSDEADLPTGLDRVGRGQHRVPGRPAGDTVTQTPGQRTASTVLDLIDGAIGGDTDDAMRWSPEPVNTMHLGHAAEVLEVQLRQGSFTPVSPVRRYFNDVIPATWTLCWKHAIEAQRAWLDRRARLRRMHTAYGRRRR